MKRLNDLSDNELTNRLRKLVPKEQDLTLEILPFPAEVGSRGLYLARGYGSLYEYCKGELGYTDASAWRRVRAALAIQRCPEAFESLTNGQVTMCTLGRVHKFISAEVLSKIRGKSQAEVELIAAAYDAKGAAPDRTRPVMIPKAIDRRADTKNHDRLRSEVSAAAGTDSPGTSLRSELAAKIERLEFEKKWKVEGVVSGRVKEKLDRCKLLLSSKYPNGIDYETLFDELTDVFLERKDPERRAKRKKATAKTGADRAANTRYVPQHVKDKVWTRDGGKCAYVEAGGKRCNSTYNLQFDHYPVPFGRGGPSTVNNLRLLCAKHNRYTAKDVYGEVRRTVLRPAGIGLFPRRS
jgi:5-methylcytosine-specific restriction endonuclease McrA